MDDRLLIILLILFGVVMVIAIILFCIDYNKKQKAWLAKQEEIKAQIRGLADNSIEMTPEEFFAMRNLRLGGQGRPSLALTENFEGVYILFNKTKNKYYIGQGQEVLNSINKHLQAKATAMCMPTTNTATNLLLKQYL